jgi:hypothetical protein
VIPTGETPAPESPRFGTPDRRRAWKVSQRYLPEQPTVVALLDQARRLEQAMRAAGLHVAPASVLIRTDGLTVTVAVTAAATTQAISAARALIAQLAAAARLTPADLGRPGDATVRPGWRPSSR